MAFLNNGPDPKIIINENGVRYIDPNPTDEIVNHEDLVTYVKLVARTKGRSIITSDGQTTEIEAELKNVNKDGETNFTYSTGDSYIDTRWTNIGGGVTNLGEDNGSLGITNINIEFKSSFMPQITIDFVDVRGATLFEQGPCSPYSLFFHLPYPVFELTVKGYYGKPVTYTLALTKFNTKFNSETGNFESKAEFVGYTYAFLADIPIGYVMAATYMKKSPYDADDLLKNKWDALRSAHPELTTGSKSLPEKPLTMFDLVRRSKKLETEIPRLKNTTEVIRVAELSKARQAINNLRSKVLEYQREFLTAIGGNKSTSGIRKTSDRKNTLYILTPKTGESNGGTSVKKANDINEIYLSSLDDDDFGSKEIGLSLAEAKSEIDNAGGLNVSELDNIKFENIKQNMSNFYNTTNVENSNYPDYNDWYIDIYPNLLKPIEEASRKIDEEYKKARESTQEQLNDRVREILGFWPSIRNVFAIILTNVEVFLQLLIDASIQAENYHNDESFDTSIDGTNQGLLELLNSAAGAQLSNEQQSTQQNTKVYPWPTYWRKEVRGDGDESDPGEKEEYPGENENFVAWPEVRFVEAFITALTELREDLQDLEESQVDNEPGFDDYVPMTAFETSAFGDEKAPSRWYRIESCIPNLELTESIACIVGENAFLFGDYSTINSLTVWKSQIGFKNGWGFETLTNGVGTSNGYDGQVTTGPQTLANNPAADTSKDQLDRFPNAPTKKGFDFPTSIPKDRHNWTRHISPVTKAKMEDWGKIDALNFLSVASSTQQRRAINAIKSYLEGVDEDDFTKFVIEKLKKKAGDDFKDQKFGDWKNFAVNEIGGTEALIEKQSNIWSGHYSYVKTNNVLSLKGPIELSYFSEATETKIHPNPNRNAKEGVRLDLKTNLGSRKIEISKDRVQENLYQGYREVYGVEQGKDTSATQTAENESSTTTRVSVDKTAAVPENSIRYKTLLGIPKWRTAGNSPYSSSSTGLGGSKFNFDEQTNMLTYDLQKAFYGLFFFNYEDHGNDAVKKNSRIINDLGASRSIYTDRSGSDLKSTTFQWANFVGQAINDDEGFGAGDAFVQTPLWTLNYPRYKLPIHGNSENVDWEESIYRHNDNNSQAGESTNDPLVYKNNGQNISRNFGTWWGLNTYYIRDGFRGETEQTYTKNMINEKRYVLPLAYLAVMSFGIDNPRYNNRSGHFPPFDGDWFYDDGLGGAFASQLSSFSNFTHTHVTAEPPKAWLLLIGAILWRAKEGKMLQWKGIEPENKDLNNYKGWNADNKSIGADDLSDPVWFFHNGLSSPWYFGGTVFSDPQTGSNWQYGSPYYTVTYFYNRSYAGIDKSQTHRWTSSYTFPSKKDKDKAWGRNINNTPKYGFLIGPTKFDTNESKFFKPPNSPTYSVGWAQKKSGENYIDNAGWTKSHFLTDNNEKGGGFGKLRTSSHNIVKGLFDQCRQDQIPFIMNLYKGNWKPSDVDNHLLGQPKTLIITSYNNKEDGTAGEKYREWTGSNVPAVDTLGNVSSAPNRVENAYPVLKEDVKELMFLPKSLMESFISYFETWAVEDAFNNLKASDTGNASYGWLSTLDPLNWAPKDGISLTYENRNFVGYYDDQNEAKKTSGYFGWLDIKEHYKKVVDGFGFNEVKSFSKWFRDNDKIYNLWYQAYGVDGGDDNNARAGTTKASTISQSKPSNSSTSSARDVGRSLKFSEGNQCFVAGTKIMLANGKEKNIEDVFENDVIKSYNIDGNYFYDTNFDSVSVDYKEETIIITLSNGIKINCTREHPIYIKNKGWASYNNQRTIEDLGTLNNIEIGDEVLYYSKGKFINLKIEKIIESNKQRKVYNLRNTGDNNNFIANGVLVHNRT